MNDSEKLLDQALPQVTPEIDKLELAERAKKLRLAVELEQALWKPKPPES